MKSINSKKNFRQFVTVTFLLMAIFYLPVSAQPIANLYNQAQGVRLYNKALELLNEGTEEAYKQALPKFQEAARLCLAANSKKDAAVSLTQAGIILHYLGENTSAISFFQQALSLFQAVSEKSEEAEMIHNIGIVYSSIGERQKALEYLYRALPMRKAFGTKSDLAMTLVGIGAELYASDNNQEALNYYNQALEIIIEIKDKNKEATIRSNIAAVYFNLGNNERTLKYLTEALELNRAVNNKRAEGYILSNIGAIYRRLNEKRKALVYLQQSIKIRTTIGDQEGEAITRNIIGGIYYDLKEYRKALENHQAALSLSRKINSGFNEATSLINQGITYASLGENQKATESYESALSLVRKIDYKLGEAAILNNKGLLYHNLGERKKTVECYSQVLPIIKQTQNKTEEAITLGNLMRGWDKLDNPKLAIFFGQLSIDKIQQLRDYTYSSLIENATQKFFLGSFTEIYQKLAELLITQKKLEKGVQVLRLYQDQQFFDFNRDFSLPDSQTSQSSLERKFSNLYEAAGNKIRKISFEIEKTKRQAINRQGDEQDEKRLERFETELNSASKEFLTVLKRAETEFAKSTDNDGDKIPPIKDIIEMQSVLQQLNSSTKQETAVLYTLVGEKKFYILLITAKGNVKVFESPIDKQNFNEKLIQLYALLQSPAYDPRILAQELYKIIVPQKLEEELKNQKIQTLMWQLDGNLRYIPVAALWDGEKYLVEKYQNVIITRADMQRLLKETKPNWTGTGFGTAEAQQIDLFNDSNKIDFPGLVSVREELADIFITGNKDKGILKGEVYADKDFTKEKFYKALKNRRPVVHISSHFSFYPGDSALSFLVLGDGTPLTLNEMKEQKGLFEGVELLTLSACETGAVLPNADGREIDGFAELAQRLGANAVMASLWQVREHSTSDLMTEFYSNRQKGKLNKAESLRLAQLKLIKGNIQSKTETEDAKQLKGNETLVGRAFPLQDIEIDKKYRIRYQKDPERRYAHPYYWSPFILFGNWK